MADQSAPFRLLLVEGRFWGVERRHAMAQLARVRPDDPPRVAPLYLLFHSAAEVRRVLVPADLPESLDDQSLREWWSRAEVLSRR